MNSQKIINLAEGDISETSTDAVNGGQLYNTNQAVIANAENINSLSHSLNKLDSRINRVGAGAAALAALHPLDFEPVTVTTAVPMRQLLDSTIGPMKTPCSASVAASAAVKI